MVDKPLKNVDNLRLLRKKLLAETKKEVVRVCCGTGCSATGGEKVLEALSEEVSEKGLNFEVRPTGCQGFCEKGPLVVTEPSGILYQRVKPFDARKIADLTLVRNQAFDGLLYVDSTSGKLCKTDKDIPFYQKQLRLVLRNCGHVDPTSIDDYIKLGGYSALEKVLSEMAPQDVIDEIKASGLRGRGGAGFPTGLKWELTRKIEGNEKYVICNGDEGDPGAFMDRSVMEGDPHSVLEGMIICAYAIGDIRKGLIYARAEYPLAVKHLKVAINQAQELGLLGSDILGSGFDFDIEIKRGAGAFVCGESTALMFSIEGKRGMPRVTPPRSVERGLWAKPTCLNNVETFANVPIIIEKGAGWYSNFGTENSKGTKVFALTGKVKNTGLIEVPMGVTLREIVFDIGGGILDNKKFKAVQIGGPSGGCVPEEHLDITVDFESLQKVGSMMGSGGLVVVDDDTCMVDLARFFLSFTQKESCGKCPPCRIGTYEMLTILDRIVAGEGKQGDIESLEEIGKMVISTSLCGLGQSAPNPVLSTIRYFRNEYESHINDGNCLAKACRSMGSYRIESNDCILCGLCKSACAFEAIIEERDRLLIDEKYCTHCGACISVCPTGCVVNVERGALLHDRN